MLNVSSWSIRTPIPSLMLFMLLTFAGLVSFSFMKVQNFPDIDLPTVTVAASLPGASPAQLETDVARKMENAIATVQGLKHVYTKVQDGVVTLTAEFRLEKPVQEAVDDVRGRHAVGITDSLVVDLTHWARGLLAANQPPTAVHHLEQISGSVVRRFAALDMFEAATRSERTDIATVWLNPRMRQAH